MVRPSWACLLLCVCGCGLLIDTDPDGDDGVDAGSDAGNGEDASAAARDAGDAAAADGSMLDAARADAGPVPVVPCGGPSVLFDVFDDGVKAPFWVTEAGTTTEADGRLSLDPAESAGAPQLATYASAFDYDARVDRVSVRVLRVIDTPGVQTTLTLFDRAGVRSASIGFADGLLIGWMGSVIDSEPYDATGHAWWQIRSDGTNVSFEVSPDGERWRRLGSGATARTPDWFEAVQLMLLSLADPGIRPVGTADMANVNWDPPRAMPASPERSRYCLGHELRDQFDDEEVDPYRWYRGECAITEGMGLVKLGATSDPRMPCAIATRHGYDLSSSHAIFERATTVPADTWAISAVDVRGNFVAAACVTGSLVMSTSLPGLAPSSHGPCPSDRFWRMEVRGGAVQVSASADGTAGSWSSDYSLAPAGFETGALRLVVATMDGFPGTEVEAYNP